MVPSITFSFHVVALYVSVYISDRVLLERGAIVDLGANECEKDRSQ